MELNKNNSTTTSEEVGKKPEIIKVQIQSSTLSSESAPLKEVEEITNLLEKVEINEQKGELQTSKTKVEFQAKSIPFRVIKNLRPAPVDEWVMNTYCRNIAKANMEKSVTTKTPIALIFDLNGTLIKRVGSNRRICLRPYIHEFIEFVMQNFHVITWTTAKPHNSYKIICKAFGPYTDYILCNLTRLHCKIFGSYFLKSPSIKDLEIIWNTEFKVDSELPTKTLPSPPTLPKYDQILKDEISLIEDLRIRDLYLGLHTNSQTIENPKILKFNKTNTILFDDSPGKAEAQPLNHLVMPEYEGESMNDTDDALFRLKKYLEEMIKEYREVDGKGEKFSVQDYMKAKQFKGLSTTNDINASR